MTLQSKIAAIVQRLPNKVAVRLGSRRVTYQELDLFANRIANFFLSQRPVNQNIALFLEKGPELIGSILGVLKYGGVFVPLDTKYPEQRIKLMLDEVQAEWLVLHSRDLERVQEWFKADRRQLKLLIVDQLPLDLPASFLVQEGEEQKHCYIYFTSGSTGKPKGVLGRCRSLQHFIEWEIGEFAVDEYLSFGQFTSPSFDPFLRDIFVPLATGATICIPASEEVMLDPAKLVDWIEENGINFMHMTPSLFKNMLPALTKDRLGSLRYILLAGEMLRGNDIRAFVQLFGERIQLVNLYGPSETTLAKFYYFIRPGDEARTNLPVGLPIDRTEALILNSRGELCEMGSIGEVYIRTPFISSGYYNQPELTRAVFLKNPFNDNPRDIIYKTGDLGRLLPDGVLELVGRSDHQIKIRGVRIEPGEIENCLLGHSEIKEAVVIDRPGADGEPILATYLVAATDRQLPVYELRKYLEKHLPRYMLPNYYIYLPTLPYNVNGKLDRSQLPEPSVISTGVEYVAAETSVQQKLVEIWSEVLQVERIGIDDNFFDLGGHSFKATHVVAKIYQETGIEVPLHQIFDKPTIRELADYVEEASPAVFLPLEPVEFAEYYPASSAQKRLFIQHQSNDLGVSYNMPKAFRIVGELNTNRLMEAIRLLSERHESLRTSFHLINGEVMQKIHPTVEPEISQLSGSADELPAMIEQFIRPFDMERAPLFRSAIIVLAPGEHVLLVDMHHSVSDGVSLLIIIKELVQLYQGSALSPLKVQFKDYAVWESKLLASAKMASQKEYWLQTLSGDLPVLEMPLDYPRLESKSFKGERMIMQIAPETVSQMNSLVQDHRVTLNIFLFAVYLILLHKYTAAEDIIVGSIVAGRKHPELYNMVGMFTNFLPVRSRVDRTQSFLQFLATERDTILQAYDNQEFPLDHILDNLTIRLDPTRNPLFDTMLIFHNQADMLENFASGNLQLIEYHVPLKSSKLDFKLDIVVNEAMGLNCIFEYNTDLFKAATIERLSQHYLNIVQQVLRESEIVLSELELVTAEEKAQILDALLEVEADYPKDRTIAQLVEEMAIRHAGRKALVFGENWMSYRELNERANQLARFLRHKGVKPNQIVAIVADRIPSTVVGILAIVKAGGAYLPINVDFPLERIDYMLTDSKARLVLVPDTYVWNADLPGEVIKYESQEYYVGDATNLAQVNMQKDLLYVIYTSGSTGKPKGVMVEHVNLIRLMLNSKHPYDFTENDVWTVFHSFSFDVSVWEMYGALMYGGRLVIVPKLIAQNAQEYLALLRQEQVTILCQTPTAFYPLMAEELKRGQVETALEVEVALGAEVEMKAKEGGGAKAGNQLEVAANQGLAIRYIIFAGEALKPGLLRDWKITYPDIKLINMYGITETTVHSTYKEITLKDIELGISNIGKPIPTLTTYIMDSGLKLLPIGVPGEICVGGDGVARGYLNQPDLTADRFVANPYKPQERLYRSGDLAKLLPSGEMEYLGRMDQQIKIRGFRVEIGEIERCMLEHEQIKAVLVLPVDDAVRGTFIAAYVQKIDDVTRGELISRDLRGYLKNKLPDYMIPSFFIFVDAFPMTVNGKIDRRQLPAPLESYHLEMEYIAPSTATEIELVAIMQEVLGIERVGVEDNFFELGGHSLKVIGVITRVFERLGVQLSLKAVFDAPTVRGLAGYIDGPGRERKVVGEKESTSGQSIVENMDAPYIVFNDSNSVSGAEVDPCSETTNPILFCFPPGRGYGLSYSSLSLHLKNHPMYCFNFIEHEQRIQEYAQIINTVQPTGELILVGYSAGGVLAYEVAEELVRVGRKVAHLIMLDANTQNQVHTTWEEKVNAAHNFIKLIEESGEFTGYIEVPEIRTRIMNKIIHYLEYLNRVTLEGTVDAKIHLIKAEGESYAPHEDFREQWIKHTTEGFYMEQGYGIHGAMLYEPHAERNGEIIRSIITTRKTE